MKEYSLEENIFQDSKDSSEKEGKIRFQAISSPELDAVAKNLSILDQSVDHIINPF